MKALFRPDPSQRPTSARPRRIPVHHFADTTDPHSDPDTDGADANDQHDNADPTTPAQLPADLDIDAAGDSPTSRDTHPSGGGSDTDPTGDASDTGDPDQHQATDTQTSLPDTP